MINDELKKLKTLISVLPFFAGWLTTILLYCALKDSPISFLVEFDQSGSGWKLLYCIPIGISSWFLFGSMWSKIFMSILSSRFARKLHKDFPIEQSHQFFEEIGFIYFINNFERRFYGRARRREFFFIHFWAIIAPIVMFFLLNMNLGLTDKNIFGFVLVCIFLAWFWVVPLFAVTIRRFHDVGLSGYWYLLTLIPVLGGIFLAVVLLLRGQPKGNKWGAIPSIKSETPKEVNFRKRRQEAQKGNADAQYDTSLSYKLGDGVNISHSASVYWLSKAADQGHKKARSELSTLSINGGGFLCNEFPDMPTRMTSV